MIEGAKPCPFCGNKKGLVWFHTEDNGESELIKLLNIYGLATICCNKLDGGCGATSGYYGSREAIIQAWNRRANPIWIGKKEEDE